MDTHATGKAELACQLDPLPLTRAVPATHPGCIGPLEWPSEQAAGPGDGQGVPWEGRLGWGAGVVGGQQVQDNGATRGGPGSRCHHGG